MISNIDATIPLEQVIPWSPDVPRKILIGDSIQSDGRFLLNTFATQILNTKSGTSATSSSSSSSSISKGQELGTTTTTTATMVDNIRNRQQRRRRLLWLTASPVTERHIATGLKKIGCEGVIVNSSLSLSSSSPRHRADGHDYPPLMIRSLTAEMATRIVNDKDSNFDGEQFLKEVYKQVKAWILQTINYDSNKAATVDDNDKTLTENAHYSPSWIFLDNVSSLGGMLGDSVVYCFIQSLCALHSKLLGNEGNFSYSSSSSSSFGIMIRCAYDLDQTRMVMLDKKKRIVNKDEEEDNSNKIGWIGAGGFAYKQQLKRQEQEFIPWERFLIELVDAIVDVLPLSSGYSREAHGRLIFSEAPSSLLSSSSGMRNWGLNSCSSIETNNSNNNAPSTSTTMPRSHLVVNYCLHDNGVRTIRLRATTT